MATVGQVLTAPEAGWKRYDNTDSGISYFGEWITGTTGFGAYNDTNAGTNKAGSGYRFNFTGSKLRLILSGTGYCAKNKLKIDGVSYDFVAQEYGVTYPSQILMFEKTGLSFGEHSVEVLFETNNMGVSDYIGLDAIDIDDSGELKPPTPENPGESEQSLLRVTMIDSSEREYKLPKADIDGFIGWLDSHSSGNTLSYPLNTAFGSKEHLLFDKIISFEVIPVA